MKLKFLVTHLLVGLLGLFLARTVALSSHGGSQSQGLLGHQNNLTSEAEAKATKSQNTRRTSSAPRSRDYLSAWQALPDQPLSVKDRLSTQKRLLREWAKVDLTAAIEAALTEAWDDDRDGEEAGPLASIFREAFAQDPEGSWHLIQSGKFGVGAGLLRRAWYQTMVSQEPVLLSKMLSQVPFSDLDSTVALLASNAYHTRKYHPEIAKALLALPEDLIDNSHIIRFLPPREASELSAALREMNNFDSREASLLLHQLAKEHQDYELSVVEEFSLLRQQLKEFPKEVQGQLLFNVLTNNDSRSYWGGRHAGKGTLTLLNLMVEGEHWEELGTQQARDRLKYQTGELPDDEVAAWSVNLPEREELARLFVRGVIPYIMNNMEPSWDWIQEFPSGLWRDRALAEYSQQAWQNHDDYEASRRALDAIENPDFKAFAESWRPPHIRALDRHANEGEDP
ncbi:MAG: hypothetical protein ACSHYB_19370 [Roseibacillus sp.]